MARRRRSVEIMSLSAIDLFASTLGAFVIITAILMPYYPNMKDGGAITAHLRAEIDSDGREVAAAEEAIRDLTAELERKEDEKAQTERAEAERKALEERARALKSANDDVARQIGKLRAELKSVKAQVKAKNKTEGPEGLTDFSILGITTKAKKILIVVDLSGSMQAWSRTLVRTLNEIVEPFHKDIQFGIIGYQGFGISQYWPTKGRLAIADDASKASARRFISRIPRMVRGGTPTKLALLNALRYRPEAIILVSDGAPDDAEPESIITSINLLNRRRVEIHTVAIGLYLQHSKLIQFMNQLAKDNKGQFVGVLHD